MHRWYVIGLFERAEVSGRSPVGYAAIWAVIDGPVENRVWALRLENQVTPKVKIKYKGSTWSCQSSYVVNFQQLAQYGLQRGEHAAPQMVLPGLEAVV